MHNIRCEVTSYDDHAYDVLKMRNNNRPNTKTKAYLDWRYIGYKSKNAPKIIWIKNNDNKKIGMVGVIYREYWLGNKKKEIAVIGDISLNKESRGKGIGKKLFQCLNEILIKENSVGFVIPNTAAKKSLMSVGWHIEEKLIPHLFLINPAIYIKKYIKSNIITNVCGYICRRIINKLVLSKKTKEYEFVDIKEIDDLKYQLATIKAKKRNFRERSCEMLQWRYFRHPDVKYHFLIIKHHNNSVGYIVYTLNPDNNGYIIYDFIVNDSGHVKYAIKSLIYKITKEDNVAFLRILLNHKHPYTKQLSRTGFIKRESTSCFQTFNHHDRHENFICEWFIGSGDKDV